jgi:hypothetical protein
VKALHAAEQIMARISNPTKAPAGISRDDLMALVGDFRQGIVDGIGGGSSASMCDAVCFPLQGFLAFAENIETRCRYGFFETSSGALQHYWLEMENGEIIDPTADQLEAHGFPKLPGVYIGPRPGFYPEPR